MPTGTTLLRDLKKLWIKWKQNQAMLYKKGTKIETKTH